MIKIVYINVSKLKMHNLKFLKGITIPKPHVLADKPLQADVDILGIVNELSRLLPQLNDFINQFNNQIITNNINVITDTAGNLSIEVPDTITEAKSKLISSRVSLLDNLIQNHLEKSEGLIHEGILAEEKLMDKEPEYETKLTPFVSEFNKLRSSYRHC
jgi:hypothetical protein